ncbi:MAG TPA: low-specificity L-threonine aldolase [Phycisphaerae bacterium]|nr:low-specificity L-threonine aldolase [Phycisphaerae bacterium]
MIDLRSDTVTRPTPEMRRAMAEADVGDDVLGDDPTVARLEARVCDVLGKEAAVYMPSGTMTNQVAIRAWTEPGDEIILEASAHSYFYESGGPAALAGVMCRLIDGERGLFTADQVRAVLRPANEHFPRTKLVAVENTHNRGGGTVWPLEQIAEVEAVAREAGLAMHLDGARLWNAAVASGIAESEYASHFDSVSVCFSKGLGAPVGSALAGDAEFVSRARRFRKMFGGGMRQAGIIAAGALYALDHHRERLIRDHANAKRLAEGIAGLDGIEIDTATVETNIVIFRVTSMAAPDLVERLGAAGVLVLARDAESIRAVANLNVTADQVEETIEHFTTILAGR